MRAPHIALTAPALCCIVWGSTRSNTARPKGPKRMRRPQCFWDTLAYAKVPHVGKDSLVKKTVLEISET